MFRYKIIRAALNQDGVAFSAGDAEVANGPRRGPEGESTGSHQPADGDLGRRDPAPHPGSPGQPRAHPRRAAGDGRPLRREDQRGRDRGRDVGGRGPATARERGRSRLLALKASLRAIEKGASLSEVLTYLVNE